MLHPDVCWYYLNGMSAQKNASKKVHVTLFPYIFHVKTKWNIIHNYLKTTIFSSDTNTLRQMHWTSNSFEPSATNIWGFLVSLNYPILNFKKTVTQKRSGCGTALYSYLTRIYIADNTINYWSGTLENVCMKRAWLREDVKKGGPALKLVFLFVNWTISEKIWELRTYFFDKNVGTSGFVTSPFETLGKAKLHPWKSCKIV